MLPLDREIITLGRRQADVLLDDPRASGAHAEIRREGKKHRLVDLGSTNGTLLNQKKVREAILSDQDVIEIGSTVLCYFADIRDFHGEADEMTHSQKKPAPKKVPEFQELSRVTEWSTTSKKIPIHQISLEVIQGEDLGRQMDFQKIQVSIGRTGCDLTLSDRDLSRKHCMIETLSRSSIFVKDLNSTNGTFLNGDPIKTSRLQSGDLIGIGSTIIRFDLKDPQ
jgi:pSer/pThr/pTyr-binding forkhead associated (FHA) protein